MNYLLSKTKTALLLMLMAMLSTITKAQIPTANSFSSQITYNGNYRYGINQGYYNGWSAENTATIAAGNPSLNIKGVGVKTLRVPLYDDFLSQWGLTVELGKFQAYASLGEDDLTAFVGSPSAAHRDPTTYPGSPEQSKAFKNLYEPIWLDAAQTQVNPNNYYAKYLYDVVTTYGSYVKFWEVINEPDFTYSSAGWMGDQNPPQAGSWYDHNPTPEELVNFRAPFQYYIRMLRVSWEVIKRLQPNDYVCIGGVGYKDFLDAILRNTDNPADGSVATNYPLKGGAYFDVVSFHCYPMYNLPRVWNNTTASVDLFRHSDQASSSYIGVKNSLDNVAASYGYNGATYPKKQYICTETGVSRIMNGTDWGSNEGQKNYLIKASVASQKNGIKQVYWYNLGDGTNSTAQFDQMGMYSNLAATVPYNQTPTDQGKALKTTSDLLYGKTYDAVRTSSLNLPSSIDGGAFRAADGSYVYVLWAKTTIDMSETANSSYSFPSTVVPGASVVRKEWNYSETNSVTTISKTNISLTGTPSFFSETDGGNSSGNKNPVVNAGADQSITLPSNSLTLNGSAADPDGMIMSYSWSQISGPSTSAILSPMQPTTILNSLVQGVYQFELKATDNLGGIGRDTVQVTVNGTSGSGNTIRIEAENYSNMSGVQTENTQDAGGGKDVGWIDNGDWMDYSVSAASAGSYTVNLRVAAPFSGSQVEIKSSAGSVLATVNIPYSGGFQTWQTVSANITLAAGTQTIRVQSTSNASFNFNWIEIVGGTSTTPPATGGTTRIEAEDYSTMNGIQTENTQDAGGGKDVGWIDNGDWMDYSVSAGSAGSYTVNLRVAAPFSGSQVQIKNSAGSVLATVNVPYTGGFQTWQTVSANITLAAGTQTIRVQSTSNASFNFNWIEIVGGTSTTPPATGGTSRIEAENYSNMSGVQTENTQDAGGGKDVGWIDNGDWMDYSVSAASAGSYTVNFRVAAPFSGSQVQIKNSAGSVLATVNVPYTGGFQTWQTVSANITLAAGTQTIRVQSTSNASFNFNWLEIASGIASAAVSKTDSTQLVSSPTISEEMSIYPNPVKDKFQLQINNSFTGKVTVQIYDMQGSLQKTLSLNKTDVGSVQFYLSIGELAAANYIIKATMTGWSQSKEIIKQ